MNTSHTDIPQNAEPGTVNAEPSTELLNDIRKRLAEAAVSPETLERARHALMHERIDVGGSILYYAGVCLSSGELREYRKTLFPPGALVDPDTNDAPVLRDRSADSVSASASDREPPTLNPEPGTVNAEPGTVNPEPVSPSETPNSEPGTPNPPSATLNPEPRTLNPGATLLFDLRGVIKRYVVLPDMAAETLALWVVHTYAFTLRQVTTYIGVVSPEKRCGKTTLLELLGTLAHRALTASNISPSAMFRVIEETRPTLLIDEADTFLEGRDELAGILNAGYRKENAYIVRVADNKPRQHKTADSLSTGGASYHEPVIDSVNRGADSLSASAANPQPIHAGHGQPATEHGHLTNDLPLLGTGLARYSCWCPKVMAAIGRLPDTLADRCILITMQRKMAGEKCDRMRNLNAADLRRRCAEFVRQNSDAIAKAQPEIPSALNDRAADIWEPLLAIADLAGDEWPALARQAAQELSATDDELTLLGYFLKDLRNLMVTRSIDRMLSRDIVAALNPVHDRPWEDLRRGREINEWWLGWQLRELGIRTRAMRTGETVGKGYLLSDIEAAFRRYIPNPELHMQTPEPAPQSKDEPSDAEILKFLKTLRL